MMAIGTVPGPPKKTRKTNNRFQQKLVRKTKTTGRQKLEVRKTKTTLAQKAEVRKETKGSTERFVPLQRCRIKFKITNFESFSGGKRFKILLCVKDR